MFNKVSKYSLQELSDILIGKNIRFISDCQLFPNFDVTGKVISINVASNNEYLIEIIKKGSSKRYKIGSNMYNLQFSIL